MKRLLCLLLTATSLVAIDNSVSKPEAEGGWLLLFDGESTFGWTPESGAHWQIADGILTAATDGGYLRTNSAFSDFILKLDYKTSGNDGECSVYVRSAIAGDPNDTAYQLEVGDAKSEWPSGSIVQYLKAEATHAAAGQWHNLEASFTGDQISVDLDGKKVAEGKNARAKAGVIGHGCSKAERVQFRNIKLKPMGSKDLFNNTDLSGWKAVGPPPPKKAGMIKKMVGGNGKTKEAKWSVAAGTIHAQGGTGQLETTTMYDDFVFQLAVRANSHSKGDHAEGGVFFRGDAGQLFTGYDVPVLNDYKSGKRNQAVPNSTGSLKGLQPARKVVSDDNQYFTETIAAYGRHLEVWINGYPVTDFQDTRAEGSSSQRDARTAAGTISLQSPDDKANLDFRNIRITQLPKVLGKGPAEAMVIAPPPPAIPTAPAAQPGAQNVFPPPDPNKPKVAALMTQSFATSDPEQQKRIYQQILALDPSNAAAATGLQQAQQKIDAANSQHAQEQAQQQQQSQNELQKQSEGEAAKQKAQAAFLHGDLDTAHNQISIAQKALRPDSGLDDLKGRIESAIQARTRLRFLWSGFGTAALIGLITAWWATRGKKNAYLEVIEGLDKGKKYNLDQEVIHIGAVAQDGGQKNEIVIRDLDRRISRFHCEIHQRGGKFFLIDCGSANGTKVDHDTAKDGKPVRIKNGARVALAGTCVLRMGYEKREK